MSLPDPAAILDLIEAFRRSKTMFAAVALGVFDHLHETPSDVSILSKRIAADRDALERLLDACASLGLLRKEGSRYANEPISDTYLCRSSPHALTGYVLYSNQALFRLWSHLEDAVREGTHRWEQTFGWKGPIFDHFFQTPESMRDFVLGMHGFGLLSSPAVVTAFDLSRFCRLIDVGGATGHLAIVACQHYPRLHAIVFDLPKVIQHAREFVGGCSVRDRIELQGGDFFADELPEGDLYALSRILHDWPEDKIRALLRKIYDRLPAQGALLIAEKLLDEDKSGPTPAHMQSLNMLVCTEGKERTLPEYAALLRDAGFSEVQGKRTGAPLDAVLAAK